MKRQKGSKWSNSRINTFQTCARQYKYKYIEKDNIQKNNSGKLSVIESLNKTRSTSITEPITRYKYSEIL